MERFLMHRREPFEIIFLIFLILSGTTQLISRAVPGSVAALLPEWVQYLWASLLVIGSATALFGVLWRDVVTGLFAENFGLTLAGAALVIYGAAVAIASPVRGAVAVGLCVSCVIGFHYRQRELRRVIRGLPRK